MSAEEAAGRIMIGHSDFLAGSRPPASMFSARVQNIIVGGDWELEQQR